MRSTGAAASTGVPSAAPPGEGHADRGYYKEHLGQLPRRLVDAVPRDELKRLHVRSGWRHLLVLSRNVLLGALCFWLMVAFEQPWIWIPAALVQGTVILGFIILLHDTIHGSVFRRRRPALSRALELLYGLPSALSPSQFKRWHLDHHRELGSAERDPKRAHLSPKRNARWLKFLYMTPALFVIYAKAANAEARTYDPAFRRTILLERLGNICLHLAFAAAVWLAFDGAAVVRAYVVPMFVFFPPAFMLNRLGQHYWIDRRDPAKWGTRVDGSPLVNFLFLNSNYHLEHHYFPTVPLYNLPRLNRRMRVFWDGIGHPNRSYPSLMWGWFVKNGEAHTDWH